MFHFTALEVNHLVCFEENECSDSLTSRETLSDKLLCLDLSERLYPAVNIQFLKPFIPLTFFVCMSFSHTEVIYIFPLIFTALLSPLCLCLLMMLMNC